MTNPSRKEHRKAPPKSVEHLWAWDYTLAKLEAKDQLTSEGNPQNYAAAMAIYKAVVNKYGNDPEFAADGMAALDRIQAVAWSQLEWRTVRGDAQLIAENVDRYYLAEPAAAGTFRVYERYDDASESEAFFVKPETFGWIVRNSPDALRWVEERRT